MFTVALTGGIGSGKSETATMFADLGIPIVDLDAISHQLTAPNKPLVSQIAACFGDDYVTKDGGLDRAKMRQLVFDDADARSRLNAILHPAIHNEAIKQLDAHKNRPYAILVIPLLDENSVYKSIIDRVLVIDCEEATQINRVKQRSQLDENQIKKIIDAQMPRQARLAMADDIIKNNGNINVLRQKVNQLHQKYINTCIHGKTIP
jgi:dephospho-CoA kinase